MSFPTPGVWIALGSHAKQESRVTLAGREISLTPTEYALLKTLALSAGKVLTHRNLLREVWGPRYADDANLLRVNISNLRHKIESNPAHPLYIVTESGVGYRLRVDAK